MKLIKKHLVFLLVAGLFSLSSCSNDDDGDTQANTVVGTWTLVEITPAGFIDLEECPNKPVINFMEDLNAEWTFYTQDNNCEGSTDTGTWKQNSATEYTINVPDLGEITGTVTFNSSTNFTFSGSYNSFPFTMTFEK